MIGVQRLYLGLVYETYLYDEVGFWGDSDGCLLLLVCLVGDSVADEPSVGCKLKVEAKKNPVRWWHFSLTQTLGIMWQICSTVFHYYYNYYYDQIGN